MDSSSTSSIEAKGQGKSKGGAPVAESPSDLPTSFGVFNPKGHVMLGLPSPLQVDDLVRTFEQAGWASEDLHQFAPRESVSELAALVDGAGPLAGFGYEITLLRRYLKLAREGFRWLLVKVDGVEQAAVVAAIAAENGAALAVHYRAWVVEEIL